MSLWFVVGCICMIVAVSLVLYAWKHRHEDPWWSAGKPPFAPRHDCASCRQGIAEIEHTTITGSWICPECSTPHTFVDGKPGRIDP
jgi:hypothetical protein